MERHRSNFLRPRQQTVAHTSPRVFAFFPSVCKIRLFFHPSQFLSPATKMVKTCTNTYLSVLGGKLSTSPFERAWQGWGWRGAPLGPRAKLWGPAPWSGEEAQP